MPGITAAGPNPGATYLTPPTVDSEIVVAGSPLSIDVPPATPPDGIPTPAIFTRACLDLTGTRRLVVDAGLSDTPKVPHLHTGLGTAGDPRLKPACPKFQEAFAYGRYIASTLLRGYSNIYLAESVPGGTTTAMTVLRLCGLDFRSSSSMPDDPTELKESVYNDTVSRIARKTLSPGDAVKEAGDYMMCVALGIISESDGGVILAGGGHRWPAYLTLHQGYWTGTGCL